MFTFLTFRINYFCSSLNCSSAVQLGYTLSQKNLDFSVQNFQKCLFFVVLNMARMGVAKTKRSLLFPGITISRFIHTPTRKSNLPKSLNPQQNQPKIQFHPSNTLYRTPYRKIPYFTHKFTNSILKINNQTFLKPHSPILVSSLLISTFYDTHFLIKLYTIYPISQHLPTRGYIKTITLSSPQTTYIIKSNPKI